MKIRTTRTTLMPAIAAATFLAACSTSSGPPATASASPAVVSPATAPAGVSGKATVQWLGQAATKITTPGGKVIVIDPWLTTNPKTPEGFKRLEALGKVDLILVTHAAYDHYGDTAAIAARTGAPIVCGGDVRRLLMDEGIPAAQIQATIWGVRVRVAGIVVRPVGTPISRAVGAPPPSA